MAFSSLEQFVQRLEQMGELKRISYPADPHLEITEICDRVVKGRGPALLFERPKGYDIPLLTNAFGSRKRMSAALGVDDLEDVARRLEDLIGRAMRMPRTLGDKVGLGGALLGVAATAPPRKVSDGPCKEVIVRNKPSLDFIPIQTCWPDDGGPFITLPLVITRHPVSGKRNVGMYRMQKYDSCTTGMHWQLHKSGAEHSRVSPGPFPVAVCLGGDPCLTYAATAPLPPDVDELLFAGWLRQKPVELVKCETSDLEVPATSDIVLEGYVDPADQRPEGPFGDHLGYYSLAHPFPVLKVEQVFHRKDAIWPFTVVGRPPQEDTSFGAIIHEITGPIIPTVVHGVHAVHAVDAAGVHPLLLAIGSERYTPFAQRRRPQELLTSANAILGQGQLSLAKFLLIIAKEDAPDLDIHDIRRFFTHLLERIDWSNDVHFQTRTTIDTLDYSGSGLNEGSKVVLAAVGAPRRKLPTELPSDLRLPEGFTDPRMCLPGVLAITSRDRKGVEDFCAFYQPSDPINGFPLIVLVDDSEFVARTLNNFVWVTFTRSSPAADIAGIGAFTSQKHWGCTGSLVIDARIKPHHAPPLVEDPEVTRRVDALGAPGRVLHGIS